MKPDPISPELKAKMNKVAKSLDEHFGRSRTFTLLVADTSGSVIEPRLNYISNGERPQILAMMREFIAKHQDEKPMEMITSMLPTLVPKDAKEGDKFAVVFTVGDPRIPVRTAEFLEWHDEDHDIED